MSSHKSFPHGSAKPIAHGDSEYGLGTIDPDTRHAESSSAKELDFGPTTKIEGKTGGGSATDSQEDIEPHENSVGDGVVKVTTDVQIDVKGKV